MKRALAYVAGIMTAANKSMRLSSASSASSAAAAASPPGGRAARARTWRPRSVIARVTAPPLSNLESRILDILLAVARDHVPGLTLRVAGGWVRDKLLLLERAGRLSPPPPGSCVPEPLVAEDDTSVDIDIALDIMMGESFADHVNKWLVERGEPPASGGVIPSNPDQSKHLATARMRLLGVWVDLVNLRTETYANNVNSRIPDVDIGTPVEDAMRRDLTINALFYNVNTREVEDYTGYGVADLRARVVRTPLPPLTTLLDDPLRALRAIRFASRLNFNFDPALYEACRSANVHAALGAKVSRERVLSEVDQIVSCRAPIHALGLLVELGLFPVVFRLPHSNNTYVDEMTPPEDFPAAALGCLINLDRLCHHRRNAEVKFDYSRIARYSALMAPVAQIQVMFAEPSTKKRKPRPVSVAHYILRAELRMSTKDIADIDRVLASSLEFKSLVHRGLSKDSMSGSWRSKRASDIKEGVGISKNASPRNGSIGPRSSVATELDRLVVGRQLRTAGPLWRVALQTALISELSPAIAAETYARGVNAIPGRLARESEVLVEAYAAFQREVESMGLEGVWDAKPLINGRELTSILPKLPRGPVIGEIMCAQVDHVIENPSADVDDVRRWLLATYKSYR